MIKKERRRPKILNLFGHARKIFHLHININNIMTYVQRSSNGMKVDVCNPIIVRKIYSSFHIINDITTRALH